MAACNEEGYASVFLGTMQNPVALLQYVVIGESLCGLDIPCSHFFYHRWTLLQLVRALV